MKKEPIQRRDYIIEKMTALGFEIIKPDGASIYFAKIPAGYNQDSFAFLKILPRRRPLPYPWCRLWIATEKAMFAYLMQLAWRPSKKP